MPKGKGGRPKGSGSKYERKYCKLLVDFFEAAAKRKTRVQFKWERTETEGDGKDKKATSRKTEIGRICAQLPTIEGFARSIKIPSTTVRQWARDHEEFAVAYGQAKDIQRDLLVDRGLTRQYDASAFVFVAKNITDMTDKSVLSGDPTAPLMLRTVTVDAGEETE